MLADEKDAVFTVKPVGTPKIDELYGDMLAFAPGQRGLQVVDAVKNAQDLAGVGAGLPDYERELQAGLLDGLNSQTGLVRPQSHDPGRQQAIYARKLPCHLITGRSEHRFRPIYDLAGKIAQQLAQIFQYPRIPLRFGDQVQQALVRRQFRTPRLAKEVGRDMKPVMRLALAEQVMEIGRAADPQLARLPGHLVGPIRPDDLQQRRIRGPCVVQAYSNPKKLKMNFDG